MLGTIIILIAGVVVIKRIKKKLDENKKTKPAKN